LSNMADMRICAEAFADGRLLSPAMNAGFMNWIPIPVVPGAPQESYTGLGIVKYKSIVGNSGGTYGYTSWMWRMPSKDATLVAFFNQTSTFTPSREAKEQEKWLRKFGQVDKWKSCSKEADGIRSKKGARG